METPENAPNVTQLPQPEIRVVRVPVVPTWRHVVSSIFDGLLTVGLLVTLVIMIRAHQRIK